MSATLRPTCSFAYGMGSASARRPGRVYISPSSFGPSSTCSRTDGHAGARDWCASRRAHHLRVVHPGAGGPQGMVHMLRACQGARVQGRAQPGALSAAALAPTSVSAASALASSSVYATPTSWRQCRCCMLWHAAHTCVACRCGDCASTAFALTGPQGVCERAGQGGGDQGREGEARSSRLQPGLCCRPRAGGWARAAGVPPRANPATRTHTCTPRQALTCWYTWWPRLMEPWS